jgi:cystathionine beta-synthase
LNVDFSLIDGFTKVTDKDAAVYTRRIARRRYLLKFGRSTLRDFAIKRSFQARRCRCSFISRSGKPVGKCLMMTGCANVVFLKKKAEDVIKDHIDKPLIVGTEELVSHAIERMRKYKITNSVMDINGFVGPLTNLVCFKATLMIKFC